MVYQCVPLGHFFLDPPFRYLFFVRVRKHGPLIPDKKQQTMKAFSIGVILVLQGMLAFAQAPQQFSFQGVARKADGKVAGNATVSIRVTMHSETVGGTAVYQETHTTQTNVSGIFNIRIGGGAVVSGNFAVSRTRKNGR